MRLLSIMYNENKNVKTRYEYYLRKTQTEGKPFYIYVVVHMNFNGNTIKIKKTLTSWFSTEDEAIKTMEGFMEYYLKKNERVIYSYLDDPVGILRKSTNLGE